MNRDELIKSALMDKLSNGFNIYTADDILTVADISNEEMQTFQAIMQAEIERLAINKRKKEH